MVRHDTISETELHAIEFSEFRVKSIATLAEALRYGMEHRDGFKHHYLYGHEWSLPSQSRRLLPKTLYQEMRPHFSRQLLHIDRARPRPTIVLSSPRDHRLVR